MQETDVSLKELSLTIASSYPDAVWLADVDDTLTDTARMHSAASRSIVDVLVPTIAVSHAQAISQRLDEIFQIMITFHQSASQTDCAQAPELRTLHDDFQRRISAYQAEIEEQWGVIRRFSREVLLKLAGEDCGVDLTSAHIDRCIDHYWAYIMKHADCFSDAVRLTETLERIGSPLYLITSSDGRMTLEDNGQFSYDPDFSRRDKAARMEHLRAKGIRYRKVFIGDPVDKPAPEFFRLAYAGIEHDLQRRLEPQKVIIVGDSYRSDLQTPVTERTAALGIHYRRGQDRVTHESDRIFSLGSLSVVSDLLISLQ